MGKAMIIGQAYRKAEIGTEIGQAGKPK